MEDMSWYNRGDYSYPYRKRQIAETYGSYYEERDDSSDTNFSLEYHLDDDYDSARYYYHPSYYWNMSSSYPPKRRRESDGAYDNSYQSFSDHNEDKFLSPDSNYFDTYGDAVRSPSAYRDSRRGSGNYQKIHNSRNLKYLTDGRPFHSSVNGLRRTENRRSRKPFKRKISSDREEKKKQIDRDERESTDSTSEVDSKSRDGHDLKKNREPPERDRKRHSIASTSSSDREDITSNLNKEDANTNSDTETVCNDVGRSCYKNNYKAEDKKGKDVNRKSSVTNAIVKVELTSTENKKSEKLTKEPKQDSRESVRDDKRKDACNSSSPPVSDNVTDICEKELRVNLERNEECHLEKDSSNPGRNNEHSSIEIGGLLISDDNEIYIKEELRANIDAETICNDIQSVDELDEFENVLKENTVGTLYIQAESTDTNTNTTTSDSALFTFEMFSSKTERDANLEEQSISSNDSSSNDNSIVTVMGKNEPRLMDVQVNVVKLNLNNTDSKGENQKEESSEKDDDALDSNTVVINAEIKILDPTSCMSPNLEANESLNNLLQELNEAIGNELSDEVPASKCRERSPRPSSDDLQPVVKIRKLDSSENNRKKEKSKKKEPASDANKQERNTPTGVPKNNSCSVDEAKTGTSRENKKRATKVNVEACQSVTAASKEESEKVLVERWRKKFEEFEKANNDKAKRRSDQKYDKIRKRAPTKSQKHNKTESANRKTSAKDTKMISKNKEDSKNKKSDPKSQSQHPENDPERDENKKERKRLLQRRKTVDVGELVKLNESDSPTTRRERSKSVGPCDRPIDLGDYFTTYRITRSLSLNSTLWTALIDFRKDAKTLKSMNASTLTLKDLKDSANKVSTPLDVETTHPSNSNSNSPANSNTVDSMTKPNDSLPAVEVTGSLANDPRLRNNTNPRFLTREEFEREVVQTGLLSTSPKYKFHFENTKTLKYEKVEYGKPHTPTLLRSPLHENLHFYSKKKEISLHNGAAIPESPPSSDGNRDSRKPFEITTNSRSSRRASDASSETSAGLNKHSTYTHKQDHSVLSKEIHQKMSQANKAEMAHNNRDDVEARDSNHSNDKPSDCRNGIVKNLSDDRQIDARSANRNNSENNKPNNARGANQNRCNRTYSKKQAAVENRTIRKSQEQSMPIIVSSEDEVKGSRKDVKIRRPSVKDRSVVPLDSILTEGIDKYFPSKNRSDTGISLNVGNVTVVVTKGNKEKAVLHETVSKIEPIKFLRVEQLINNLPPPQTARITTETYVGATESIGYGLVLHEVLSPESVVTVNQNHRIVSNPKNSSIPIAPENSPEEPKQAMSISLHEASNSISEIKRNKSLNVNKTISIPRNIVLRLVQSKDVVKIVAPLVYRFSVYRSEQQTFRHIRNKMNPLLVDKKIRDQDTDPMNSYYSRIFKNIANELADYFSERTVDNFRTTVFIQDLAKELKSKDCNMSLKLMTSLLYELIFLHDRPEKPKFLFELASELRQFIQEMASENVVVTASSHQNANVTNDTPNQSDLPLLGRSVIVKPNNVPVMAETNHTLVSKTPKIRLSSNQVLRIMQQRQQQAANNLRFTNQNSARPNPPPSTQNNPPIIQGQRSTSLFHYLPNHGSAQTSLPAQPIQSNIPMQQDRLLQGSAQSNIPIQQDLRQNSVQSNIPSQQNNPLQNSVQSNILTRKNHLRQNSAQSNIPAQQNYSLQSSLQSILTQQNNLCQSSAQSNIPTEQNYPLQSSVQSNILSQQNHVRQGSAQSNIPTQQNYLLQSAVHPNITFEQNQRLQNSAQYSIPTQQNNLFQNSTHPSLLIKNHVSQNNPLYSFPISTVGMVNQSRPPPPYPYVPPNVNPFQHGEQNLRPPFLNAQQQPPSNQTYCGFPDNMRYPQLQNQNGVYRQALNQQNGLYPQPLTVRTDTQVHRTTTACVYLNTSDDQSQPQFVNTTSYISDQNKKQQNASNRMPTVAPQCKNAKASSNVTQTRFVQPEKVCPAQNATPTLPSASGEKIQNDPFRRPSSELRSYRIRLPVVASSSVQNSGHKDNNKNSSLSPNSAILVNTKQPVPNDTVVCLATGGVPKPSDKNTTERPTSADNNVPSQKNTNQTSEEVAKRGVNFKIRLPPRPFKFTKASDDKGANKEVSAGLETVPTVAKSKDSVEAESVDLTVTVENRRGNVFSDTENRSEYVDIENWSHKTDCEEFKEEPAVVSESENVETKAQEEVVEVVESSVPPRNLSVDSGICSPRTEDLLTHCFCGLRADFICSCQTTVYCSKRCQAIDWSRHFEACKYSESNIPSLIDNGNALN